MQVQLTRTVLTLGTSIPGIFKLILSDLYIIQSSEWMRLRHGYRSHYKAFE
jgi:hypothetical protein